jgi:hypothetical protein
MDNIILSFDVGIVHLAYCLFTRKDNKLDILEWGNIDLTDREATKCHCGLKASFIVNKTYLCKVHSKKCEELKPFDELFKESIQASKHKCKYIDEKKNKECGKTCCYTKNDESESLNEIIQDNNYFCKTHSNALYKSLKNQLKLTPFKNKSVSTLDYDDTQLKLLNILDSKKELLKATIVLIENQPSFKNPRCKSISNTLYNFYMIRGIIDKNITQSSIIKVKFMAPSNKIKIANKEDTQELVLLKDNETKLYKLTKSLSVKYSFELIKHLDNWTEFLNKQKKKDDLADALLQGAFYFEKYIKK